MERVTILFVFWQGRGGKLEYLFPAEAIQGMIEKSGGLTNSREQMQVQWQKATTKHSDDLQETVMFLSSYLLSHKSIRNG